MSLATGVPSVGTQAVKAFEAAACVIVKHANPCGVATAPSPVKAYELAYRTDPTSAYGGVIAFNRPLDQASADAIVAQQFAEVIIAPEVGRAARAALAKKQGIRVLEAGWPHTASAAQQPNFEWKSIEGGLLVQDSDTGRVDVGAARVVTKRAPTPSELRDLKFAWTVVKYVKSNAIVLARDGATIGIGAGQPSRVMSARIAALKAEEAKLEVQGAVLASDAFFPFRDGVDEAARNGITGAITQTASTTVDPSVQVIHNQNTLQFADNDMNATGNNVAVYNLRRGQSSNATGLAPTQRQDADAGNDRLNGSGGSDRLFGGDGVDAHMEVGMDLPVSALSPTVIATFLTGFGGGGLLANSYFQLSLGKGVLAALLTGIFLSGGTFIMLTLLFRGTQAGSEFSFQEMVGKVVQVITPIPVNGTGEISRWYFREDGELECVDYPGRLLRRDRQSIQAVFERDERMMP